MAVWNVSLKQHLAHKALRSMKGTGDPARLDVPYYKISQEPLTALGLDYDMLPDNS